eukprot:3623278-Lingulodinium_polyedra.AAC.1
MQRGWAQVRHRASPAPVGSRCPRTPCKSAGNRGTHPPGAPRGSSINAGYANANTMPKRRARK